MESATEMHRFESTTKEKGLNCEQKLPDVTPESDSGIISVQLLEFKTSLLEAVEELHIQRDAEARREAQVCKLVLERQELEWQKESLKNLIDRMTKDHSESLAALKKQFQAQIREIEAEKGMHQLGAELKDKEISSLKEELKSMQLSKYSLEKKLSELEQKLQLQTQVKDSHLNQLGEVEKRFGMISRHSAVIKQAHEKLEQNVDEAVRLNNKLGSINEKQESTISTLKKDVMRLNSELVKTKVLSVGKSGEESSNFLLKDQQLQDLKQRLRVEIEFNKRLRNESAGERAEKQELMNSLQLAQQLLQTQTQAVSRTERELLNHKKEYQVLKREHEEVQERRKEKEDRLGQLIEDYKNSCSSLEKEMQMLKAKMHVDHEELKAVRDAYDLLQEKHHQAQARHSHASENDVKEKVTIQSESAIELNCDVNQDSPGSDSKAALVETEGSQASPQNNVEQKRPCIDEETIPDKRIVDCQEAAVGGAHGEVRSILTLLPSQSLDALAPDQSWACARGANVTNRQIQPNVKQLASAGESAQVQSFIDSACSLSTAQNCTDNCLAELSGPKTRSVYGVVIDPPMPESSRNVSKMLKQQTPDKPTFEAGEDSMTSAPETNGPQSVSPNSEYKPCAEEPLAEELSKDINAKARLQDEFTCYESSTNRDVFSLTRLSLEHQIASCPETLVSSTGSASDPPPREVKDQHSQPEEGSVLGGIPVQQHPMEEMNETVDAKCTPATASLVESFFRSTANMAETSSGNKTDHNSTATKVLCDQQRTFACPDLLQEKASASVTKISHQLHNGENQMINAASSCSDMQTCASSSKLNGSPKQRVGTQCFALVGRTSTFPARVPVSEQKSMVPSGFQELLTSLHIPALAKHKLRNKGATGITQPLDKMNNILSERKSDHHGEWNAIKQTFSQISTEKDCRVPISFGSARPGSPAARSGGNGLRQNCAVTPPPRLRSLGKVFRPVCEETVFTALEEEDCQSGIRAQIAKIEQFLTSEGVVLQKRRRVEEAVEPKSHN